MNPMSKDNDMVIMLKTVAMLIMMIMVSLMMIMMVKVKMMIMMIIPGEAVLGTLQRNHGNVGN